MGYEKGVGSDSLTDKQFEELSVLADFCRELQASPGWANLCDYIKRKREDPIEKEILNATLSSLVPTFEFFCYNDAMRKGKLLGIREFIKTVPLIVAQYKKELLRREKRQQGAGQRKPGRPGRK